MKSPLQVHHELRLVHISVAINVDGFQCLFGVFTSEATEIGSHEAIVQGIELKTIITKSLNLKGPSM